VTLGTSFHRYTRHWRFCFLVALPPCGICCFAPNICSSLPKTEKGPSHLLAGASKAERDRRLFGPSRSASTETVGPNIPSVALTTSWVLFICAKNLLVETKAPQAPAPKLLI